jgi:hypothetical protein
MDRLEGRGREWSIDGTDGSTAIYGRAVRGGAPNDVEAMSAAVRDICIGLPETTEHVDSWAQNYVIRRRSFCLFLALDSPANNSVPILVLRSTDDDREMYLATGDPFFEIPRNDKRIGFALGATTDWDEVRELVTDSYCMIAPKKLIALLDLPTEV